MWSSDYPHNESTFGYSEKSLASVVDAVGPENAAKIVSANIKKFLGSVTTSTHPASLDRPDGYRCLDIPTEPDFARMHREVGARLRAAMAEQGR